MKRFRLVLYGIIFPLVVFIQSCDEPAIPRRRGYLRVELPPHEYKLFNPDCAFSFEISKIAIAVPDTNSLAEPCWWYIKYPSLNGEIYISYKPVNNNFSKFAEDAHELVYKHTSRANAINETQVSNAAASGILYELKGDAASSIQFYMTDTSRHFLRGALYFHAVPNSDSLAPQIAYIKKDIEHLLSTLKWK